MRVKIREVLDDCIAQGIDTGYHRAHKYNDNPSHAEMIGAIEDEIWLEIDRHFDFEQCASRNVCDEVVKGFDQLEKEREWVGLGNKDRFWVIDEWQQLTRSVKDSEFNKAIRLCKMLEAKLKELNT
jgi:hypothetical protein